MAREARRRRARIILIDGPSGAGKSTFATALIAALGGGAALVRMDDLYPGWEGLMAGSLLSERDIVAPIHRGHRARYRRWDWGASAPSTWFTVVAADIVVIEGCGSATRRNRRLADLTVWLQTDDTVRKMRALTRDGDVFAAHWETWDRQWRRYALIHGPRAGADIVLTT
ncbi:ATP-binding protein [Microbacteriaceae bacterium VKM Ac-2855]|nr:ATP-binding protein [Microbacteriaceae bacterium VKM Ac-2855]